MKISGKYEFRGREEVPNYKDPTKTNYYVGLEEGISGTRYYVSQSVYDKFAGIKKGQIVVVDFDYNENRQFNKMLITDVKYPA